MNGMAEYDDDDMWLAHLEGKCLDGCVYCEEEYEDYRENERYCYGPENLSKAYRSMV